jgi:hypothetical protein
MKGVFAYCQTLKNYCDSLLALAYIVRCEYTIDMRPPSQAYLRGHIEFANGSELHWTEFLDTDNDEVMKLRYSYHCQDSNHALVFATIMQRTNQRCPSVRTNIPQQQV